MKLRMKHSFYLFNEIDSLPDFLIIFNLKKISVVNLQLFYYYSLFHAFHKSGNIRLRRLLLLWRFSRARKTLGDGWFIGCFIPCKFSFRQFDLMLKSEVSYRVALLVAGFNNPFFVLSDFSHPLFKSIFNLV